MTENDWRAPTATRRGTGGGEVETAAGRAVRARVGELARRYRLAPGEALPAGPRQRAEAPRLGFIGTEAAYDLVSGQLGLTLLTRRNWRAHLHADAFPALLIEPAAADVTGEWGAAFLGEATEDPDADALLRECRRRGIALLGRLDCTEEDAHVRSPVLDGLDRVYCSTSGLADALRSRGINARAVGIGAPERPRSHARSGTRAGDGGLCVACTRLGEITDDAELVQVLGTLAPFGLELFECREELPSALPVSLGPLAGQIRGCLLPGQVPSLLGRVDVLLQADGAGKPPPATHRDALDAALHGCLVLVIGEPAEDDPRLEFAHFFQDISGLRAFLSRLQGDVLEREALALASWRSAMAVQRAGGLAAALRLAAGAEDEARAGRLSVLSVLRDPAASAAVLEDFRAQRWEGREVVIVALGDRGDDWAAIEPGLGTDERIVRLSSAHPAGAAVLTAASQASGDHVVVLSSGVRFGPSMLSDLHLALSVSAPDVAVKPATFAVHGQDHALLWRGDGSAGPAAVAIRRDRVADLVDVRDDLESLLAGVSGAAARLGMTTITLDGLNAVRWLGAGEAVEGWRAAGTSFGHQAVFR